MQNCHIIHCFSSESIILYIKMPLFNRQCGFYLRIGPRLMHCHKAWLLGSLLKDPRCSLKTIHSSLCLSVQQGLWELISFQFPDWYVPTLTQFHPIHHGLLFSNRRTLCKFLEVFPCINLSSLVHYPPKSSHVSLPEFHCLSCAPLHYRPGSSSSQKAIVILGFTAFAYLFSGITVLWPSVWKEVFFMYRV